MSEQLTRAELLMTRALCGEATPAEVAELKPLLQADASLREEFRQLHEASLLATMAATPEPSQKLNQFAVDLAARIRADNAKSQPKPEAPLLIFRPKFWMSAAVACAVVTLAVKMVSRPGPEPRTPSRPDVVAPTRPEPAGERIVQAEVIQLPGTEKQDVYIFPAQGELTPAAALYTAKGVTESVNFAELKPNPDAFVLASKGAGEQPPTDREYRVVTTAPGAPLGTGVVRTIPAAGLRALGQSTPIPPAAAVPTFAEALQQWSHLRDTGDTKAADAYLQKLPADLRQRIEEF